MSSSSIQKKRNIVLHFDLNRTILMSDAAGGRSMENTVNYLLSECTWGYISPENPQKWICVSEESSIDPPLISSSTTSSLPLMTYKHFVDQLYPYQSLEKTDSTIEEIKAFNKAAKKQRTALQSAFTTSSQSPGVKVLKSFQQVMEKLHFAHGLQRQKAQEIATSSTCLKDSLRLQQAWKEGRFYLLPSFIQFLFYLAEKQGLQEGQQEQQEQQEQQSKNDQSIEFKLIFRTFGDDIVEVAKEIDFLIQGRHPFCYGKKLPEIFQLGHTYGTFYRDGFDANGTALAIGTLTKVPFDSHTNADTKAMEAFYTSQQQEVEIIRGFKAIHQKLHSMLATHTVLALRDYWEWWSAHAEHAEYGKLLLVEDHHRHQQEEDKNTDIVVFFDDHIEADHAHIVDVRDVTTGQPIEFETSLKKKYLRRVEPFLAITQPDYFIQQFEQLFK